MESYDLIPDKGLPDGVVLIEKKRFRSGPIGIKSAAEGEYGYPASKIVEVGNDIDFSNANMLTVEIEEEPSSEISERRVQGCIRTANNKNQKIEELPLLNTKVIKISTEFGKNDIDTDIVWNRGPFFIVVYGQPYEIVEALAKLTIHKLNSNL